MERISACIAQTLITMLSMGRKVMGNGSCWLALLTSSLFAQYEPQLSITPAGSNVSLTYPTANGVVYQLQTSTDLSTWQDAGASVVGNGQIVQLPIASLNLAETPRRFFRLNSSGTVNSFSMGLLALSDSNAARTYLGLRLGLDVMAFSPNLASWSGVVASNWGKETVGKTGRTTFSNSSYTATPTDRYISATGNMSAICLVMLPAAKAVAAGTSIKVLDESASANNIGALHIYPQAGDTIQNASGVDNPTGLARITSPGGEITFVSNGLNQWRQEDTLIARRIYIPAASSGNPSTGIFWDSYSTGTAITWDTAQQKMRLTSKRIDLLPLGSMGDGFVQMLNNAFDNANVFLSRQGDANGTTQRLVPGHRFGFVSGFWNGSGTSEKYAVLQGNNDGTSGFLSVFADGSLNQPGHPLTWPPSSGGTETTRFTVQGIDVLGNRVLNVGTGGISFSGTGAADTRDAIGAEPSLGKPTANGYVLTSSTDGTRSWSAPSGATSITATAKLDFPPIAPLSSAVLTVPVSSASPSNVPSVSVGWSGRLPARILVKQAWVSSVNVVSIELQNVSNTTTIDPPAIDCRLTIHP